MGFMSFETAETLSLNQDKAILERLSNRVRFHPVRMDRRLWLRGWIRKLLWGTLETMRVQRQHRYQILHARSFFPALTAWLVTLRFGGKWIYDTRNFFWEEQVEMGRSRKNLLVRWGFWIDKFLLRKADKVIAVTDAAKRIYTEQLRRSHSPTDAVTVVHNSYAPKRFGLNISQRMERRKELNLHDRIALIYSGSLVRWYLFEDMARFCNRCQAKQPNSYSLWCSYEWTDESRQWANNLLARDFLLLKLDPEEVGTTLQAADVGLMFLQPTLSNATTFPIKFAEYLASGLPVVINAGLKSRRRLSGNIGWGVVLPDMSDAAIDRAVDELVELLADPEVKQRAQEAACTEFHLDQAIEKYRQCYQALLS